MARTVHKPRFPKTSNNYMLSIIFSSKKVYKSVLCFFLQKIPCYSFNEGNCQVSEKAKPKKDFLPLLSLKQILFSFFSLLSAICCISCLQFLFSTVSSFWFYSFVAHIHSEEWVTYLFPPSAWTLAHFFLLLFSALFLLESFLSVCYAFSVPFISQCFYHHSNIAHSDVR